MSQATDTATVRVSTDVAWDGAVHRAGDFVTMTAHMAQLLVAAGLGRLASPAIQSPRRPA